MMTRTAALALLLLGTTAGAQSIDYDPRRAVELRPCDEHRYHGRTEQARACYTKLVESQTPIVEAEAAWALVSASYLSINACSDFAVATLIF